MIQTLSVRSSEHQNHNEDDYFVVERQNIIYGAVFDGCSSGVDSYWASNTLKKIFNGLGSIYDEFESDSNWDMLSIALLSNVNTRMQMVSNILKLDVYHFEATIIFFVYDKNLKRLCVRFVGDGTVLWKHTNGVISHCNNEQNNAPNYLAHHLNDDYMEVFDFLKTTTFLNLSDVDEFWICSDGIDKVCDAKETGKDGVDYLLNDPFAAHLKNGMVRKWNLLSRDGFIVKDDLTIIKYSNL